MNQQYNIACESFDSLSRLKNGPGAIVTNTLFDQMIKEFARLNLRYYDEGEDYPLQYSEPQMEPILFSSFLQAEALPFAQEPATTKVRGTPPQTGRIDFWVSHKNTIHLVEMKFRRLSWNYRSLDQIQKRWKKAIDQIGNRVVLPNTYQGKRVFKTAMLVVAFCSRSQDKGRLVLPEPDDVLERAKKIGAKLRPAPGWSSLWTLCEGHAEQVDGNYGYEQFPEVLIFTNSQGPI